MEVENPTFALVNGMKIAAVLSDLVIVWKRNVCNCILYFLVSYFMTEILSCHCGT